MKGTTIYEFMSCYIEQLHGAGKKQTANSYTSALARFMDFSQNSEFPLSKINSETIHAFRNYLSEQKVAYNTAIYYLCAIRAVYNKAVRMKIIKDNYPFETISTRIVPPNYAIIGEEELKAIVKCDLTNNKSLAFARDMFMLSFYLRGISYYDIAQLKIRNVVNGTLIYQNKEAREIVIKLEPCMLGIIKRYQNKGTKSDYLLPIYGETENFSSAVRILNIRLKKIAKLLNLNVALTSATARHSWATMALKKGLPKKVISRCLGHKNEYATQKYLKRLENALISNINNIVIGNIVESKS